MASSYTTAAATSSTKLGVTIKTSEPRDVFSKLTIGKGDPSYKKIADMKRSFVECFTKKLLCAFRTTRGHIPFEFELGEQSKEIETEWQQSFLGSETVCRRPRTS